jgi:hypothetical protein
MHTEILWGNLRERNHLEDLDVWEESFEMNFQEVVWISAEWIDLTQDRDSWQALVNAVMNLRVP